MTDDPVRPTTPQPMIPTPLAASTEPVAAPYAVPPMAVSGDAAIAPGPTVAPRRRSSGGWLNVVLAIAAAVAIGGVAFAVGRSTAPASAASGPAFANGAGQFPLASGAPGSQGGTGGFVAGPGGRFGFAGPTIDGTVESIDGSTVTIKTASGETVTVTLGSSTTYATKTPAAASDVKAGDQVEVRLDMSAIRGMGNQGGTPGERDLTADSVTVVP